MAYYPISLSALYPDPTTLQRNNLLISNAAWKPVTITDQARSHCCVYTAEFDHLVLLSSSAAITDSQQQFYKNPNKNIRLDIGHLPLIADAP